MPPQHRSGRSTGTYPKRVTVLGDAVVDVGTTPDGQESRSVGGCALNVAVMMARLGAVTTLLTCFDDDPAGHQIAALLTAENIDVVRPTERPPTSVVRVGPGPSYTFSQPVSRAAPADPQLVRRWFTADAVIASGADGLATAASAVPVHAEVTAWDPNARAGRSSTFAELRGDLERVAPHCSLLKLSDEDCALLYGVPPPAVARRLCTSGAGAVVVSHGSGGATLYCDGHTMHRPATALPAPLADTVGAGDALLAGLVAGLLLRPTRPQHAQNWDRVLDQAMRLAALVCSVRGALPPATALTLAATPLRLDHAN